MMTAGRDRVGWDVSSESPLIGLAGTAVSKGKQRIPEDLQRWIDARKRFHLSHAHIQMARELGMNPKKIGGLANHKQEPWKAPLPIWIEGLYYKRFGKERPDRVVSIEVRAQELAVKKAAQRERRRARRLLVAESPGTGQSPDQSTATNHQQLGALTEDHRLDGRARVEMELVT